MIKKNDILSFYRALVFADTTDTITAASKKAYRDFCRTIEFKQRGDHSVSVESAISVLRLGLKQVDCIQSQDSYDLWHKDICGDIAKAFKDASLNLGQTQKWVNMTMKYLLALDEQSIVRLTPMLHVPIDSVVLANSGYSKINELSTWSQITDWEDYINFQVYLREKVRKQNVSPMEWEFGIWNNSHLQNTRHNHDAQRFALYKYYKGETENPYDCNSTVGRFWHGEKMYDELQNKDFFTNEAKCWREELTNKDSDCPILSYDDVTLGIILYTDCLYGKFCPYGSFNWIFDY